MNKLEKLHKDILALQNLLDKEQRMVEEYTFEHEKRMYENQPEVNLND